MRLAIVFLIFLSASEALGQRWAFEYWHDGKIVLEEGDTLKGQIKYEINTDIIQLNQNNHLQSFTSRKVVFFEIFDATSSRYRQFYSIPYSASGGYKTPVFFELLAEGKLTLLAREALEYKTSSTGLYGYGAISRQVLVDKFFVLDDKGNVEAFTGRRNDLLVLMEKRDEEVKKFLKANRLDLEYKYDMARVFAYYNSLFEGK